MLYFKFYPLGRGAVDIDEATIFEHAAARQFYHTDSVFLFIFEISNFGRGVVIKFMFVGKLIASGFFRLQIGISVNGKHTAVTEITVQLIYGGRTVGAAVIGFETGVIINKVGSAQIWRSMTAEAVVVIVTYGRDQQQFTAGTIFILNIERVLFGSVRTGSDISAAFCNTEFCTKGNFIISSSLNAVAGFDIPKFIFFILPDLDYSTIYQKIIGKTL